MGETEDVQHPQLGAVAVGHFHEEGRGNLKCHSRLRLK
jgi:hypothetical protein